MNQMKLEFPIEDIQIICSHCLNGDHQYHDTSAYKLGCQNGETLKPCECMEEKYESTI